jgi:predicted glycosyltransferase
MLEDYVIRSEVVSLNGNETKHGCSQGLEVDCRQTDNVIRLLERFGIPYTEIVRRQ